MTTIHRHHPGLAAVHAANRASSTPATHHAKAHHAKSHHAKAHHAHASGGSKVHPREMHFGAPMPAAVSRLHAPKGNENIGDSLAWETKHHGRVMDENFQVTNDAHGKPGWQIWMMHWDKAGQNGYHYIVEPGTHHVRKMTKAEQRRPLSDWTSAQVARWRAGPSYDSRSPKTWEQAVVNAKRHNVIITPECKSRKFAYPAVAKMMVDVARKHDYPCWPMALWTMKDAHGKCDAFADAGVKFAIIFGKAKVLRPLARRTTKRWQHHPVIW